MKQTKFSPAAFSAAIVLAAAVSFSAVMCLADCFEMPCSVTSLLISCAGFSVLASTVLALRRLRLSTVLAAIFYCAALYFFRGLVLQGLEAAAYCISSKYALCYDSVEVIGIAGGDCTGILALAALPLAWITAWVLNREGSAVAAALICAPILILCLMIVDLAPIRWLVVLTGALLLLLLTGSVRSRDPHAGGRLTWLLLLPVTALITLLVYVSPPQEYERSPWSNTLQSLSEQFVPTVQTVFAPSDTDGTVSWRSTLKSVNLETVGPKRQTHIKVLEYTADTPIDYLRGLSLGVYDDNRWSAIPQEAFLEGGFDPEVLMTVPAPPNASVTVKAVTPTLMLYTPYNMTQLPVQGTPVDDAYVDNTTRTADYTVEYSIGKHVSPSTFQGKYKDYVNHNYTSVPEDIRGVLESIVSREGLNLSASPTEAAAGVANYLQNLAVYDLNTPAVPDGEDFVVHFLTESKQGYCIHFASAAAMLLRVLDIPSRYVTGYSVSGSPGVTTTVTTDEAHAWVEYYVNGIGWLPLDPTPAAENPAQPNDPTTDTPVPNQPDEPTDVPQQPSQMQERPASGVSVGSRAHRLSPWLWLLALPGGCLALCLRRWLTLSRRRRRCRTDPINRRCLHLWQQLTRTCRLTGDIPEIQWLELAQKARFSQHTMTEEEFNLLFRALQTQTEKLKHSAPALRRLWHRYGLALY